MENETKKQTLKVETLPVNRKHIKQMSVVGDSIFYTQPVSTQLCEVSITIHHLFVLTTCCFHCFFVMVFPLLRRGGGGGSVVQDGLELSLHHPPLWMRASAAG